VRREFEVGDLVFADDYNEDIDLAHDWIEASKSKDYFLAYIVETKPPYNVVIRDFVFKENILYTIGNLKLVDK